MAVNDIASVTLQCAHLEQVAVNVLYFRSGFTVGNPILDTNTAVAFEAALAPSLIACLSANAAYVSTTFRHLLPFPPRLPAPSAVLSAVGGVAGDSLPDQCCGALTKRTAFSGRKFRGRVYVPFPSEASSDVTGRPTAGYQALISAYGAAILGGVIVTVGADQEGWIPVLLHREDLSNTVITSMVTRAYWTTQRRRSVVSGAP
jgi:hypothetical protein